MSALNAFELRHLRYFIAVAEELHFGRAAARLGISQPPLSQQIIAFENALGARLFERTNRRVVLTAAGVALLNEARSILLRIEKAAIHAAKLHRGEAGELRMGFFASAPFTDEFQHIVSNYRSSNAGIGLQLTEMASFRQVEALLDNKIDVGFCRPIDGPLNRLAGMELSREELCGVVHSGHVLAQGPRSSISVSELSTDRFVGYAEAAGTGLREKVLELCNLAGFEPDVVQEASSTPTMLGLVAAGIGVSILPASLRRLSFSSVRFLTLEDRNSDTALWLYRREDDRSAAVRALFRSARTTVRNLAVQAVAGE